MPATAACSLDKPDQLEEKLRHVRQLLRSGQFGEAKSICLELHTIGHKHHELCRLLGLIHHASGDLDNAGRFFAEAIRHDPLNPVYHYNHGMVLTEQGKTGAAIAPLQIAASLKPDFSEAYLALGNIYMALDQTDKAVMQYSAAISANRNARAAYYNLAMAYKKLGFWQSAVAAMEKAATLPPPDADIFLRLGDLLNRHNLLPQATRAYVKAVNISPDNAEILEKLGDVCSRLGDNPSAVAFYRKLLSLHPRNCKVMNNLGVALLNAGQIDEAILLYRQALHISGNLAEVHYNLGNALMAKEARAEAADHYLAAIRLHPRYHDAWFNLGVTRQKLLQHAEAEQAFRRVTQLNPANAQAFFNIAVALQLQQRFDEAIACYNKALILDPDFVKAHYNLGMALNDANRHDEAIISFQSAHAIDPDDVKILNNLGLTFHDTGQLDKAVAVFLKALRLQPDFADAHANLGNSYLEQGREAEAQAAYLQALDCNPRAAKAYYNLGCLYLQRNDPDNAIAMYERAIEVDPAFVEAHWNKSNALLLRGDLADGFREYRWRWRRKSADRVTLPLPQWLGEPLPNGTILVITEQGKGDTIQFVRYLPIVRKVVGKIILACEISLQQLLSSMTEIDLIISKNEIMQYCTQAESYVPLLNLPDILQNVTHDIPDKIPYLFPNKDRVVDFVGLFSNFRKQLKVGIIWQGNPQHKNDHRRSCPPQEFTSLASLPGITLFSLQKPNGTGNEHPEGIVDLAPHFDSFADTAALMAHLDLIITVDTASLHLAGALGRQVWALIPHVPDWRWMLNRQDTPWYPGMRLFRQSDAKSWPQVIDNVREELLSLRDQYIFL